MVRLTNPRLFRLTKTRMAGGAEPGQRTEWVDIYGKDPSLYPGWRKYYNSDTPFGRACCAIVTYTGAAIIGVTIYSYKKLNKRKVEKAQ